jgi:putative membrane protein insertion efficiency factor
MMKYLYLMVILGLFVGTAFAETAHPPAAGRSGGPSTMTTPIRLYQKYLSRVDGNRCAMTPSCSHYALQAIRRHGALMGWIMTCDRLLRDGHDELKHSPLVMTRDGIRCQDPVENNDFWWH